MPKEKTINLNPDNIEEAKEIIQQLKKDKFLQKIKQNPLQDLNSLKVLKNSGFFDTSFLDNKTTTKNKLHITQQDIEDVFKIINPDTKGKKVMLDDLQEKIPFLNAKIPESEIHLLTNNKQSLTSQELFELLQECEVNDFDPIKEVFRLLDTKKSNQVDVDFLASLMKNFNIRDIQEKDKDLILECLDINKDGKIGLDDIQELLKDEFIQEQYFNVNKDQEKENKI